MGEIGGIMKSGWLPPMIRCPRCESKIVQEECKHENRINQFEEGSWITACEDCNKQLEREE